MPSARETAAAREYREFIASEQKRQLDAENLAEYHKYEQQITAERLTPLSFEDWAKLLPKNDDPAIRATFASSRANWTQLVNVTKERITSQPLDDEELLELGFDLKNRVRVPEIDLPINVVRLGLEQFAKREPKFDVKFHIENGLSEFFDRNKLFPTASNLERAFALLTRLGILSPKPEPEREPERKVNLDIEPDQALEARQRREAYGTHIVAKGPDGREYTQYELDRLSADDFKQVMRLFGERQPRFSHVIVSETP
jgi:hypothetical protein